MAKAPLSAKPPLPTPSAFEWANTVGQPATEAVDAVVENPKDEPVVETKPWEAADVRADMKKMFNLRLSEPLFIKLKWLSEQGEGSMHKIALEAIEKSVNTRIMQLSPGSPTQ